LVISNFPLINQAINQIAQTFNMYSTTGKESITQDEKLKHKHKELKSLGQLLRLISLPA